MSETPLLTRKLVGYRCWRIDHEWRLAPRIRSLPSWDRGTNEARCWGVRLARRPIRAHGEVPGHLCNCGLHAYRDFETLLRMEVPEHSTRGCSMQRGGYRWVLGAVTAWGQQVEVHDDGFRAQFMAPIALTHHKFASQSAVFAARRVAQENGLRFLPSGELEEFASGYGTLLPDQLRPNAELKGQLAALAQKQAVAMQEASLEMQRAMQKAQAAMLRGLQRQPPGS